MAVFRCAFGPKTGHLVKHDGTVATYTRNPGETDAEFEDRVTDEYALEIDAAIAAGTPPAGCSSDVFRAAMVEYGLVPAIVFEPVAKVAADIRRTLGP